MMNYKSLKTRIRMTFMITLALLIALAGIQYYSIEKIRKGTEDQHHYMTSKLFSSEIRFELLEVQQFMTDASLTQSEESFGQAEIYADMSTEMLKELESMLPEHKEKIRELENISAKFLATGKEMYLAYKAGDKAKGEELMKRANTGFDAYADKLIGDFQEIDAYVQDKVTKSMDEIKEIERKANLFVMIACLVIAMVVTINLFIIYRRVSPLEDLTVLLESRSNSLQHESELTSSTATSLGQSVTQQSAAVEETSVAIEEITQMVSNTLNSSTHLDQAADKSLNSVEKGKKVIDSVKDAMSEISTTNEKVLEQVIEGNQKILEIVKVVSEIGDKTKVIDDIVFQTKLLSFNASVEAARAGEHGKGFAVVAEEVGNLATMSGNASKEISNMLTESIQKVEEFAKTHREKVENVIDVAKKSIEHGGQTLDMGSDALDDIYTQSLNVKSLISSITQAIGEQNRGIQEIAQSISSLEQASHQNEAAANTSSDISRKLFSMSSELKEEAKKLHKVVMG